MNSELVTKLEKLISIGIALSSESNPNILLETILDSACEITNADGGTIYSVTSKAAKIEIIRNRSLGISYGGSFKKASFFPTVPLFRPDGTPNLNNVATYAVHKNTTVNIEDSYDSDKFDFSGTRSFDGKMGYRSVSFLTVPLRNHENDVIGVLQLINAQDPQSNKTIPFSTVNQRLVEALASQAATALTKEQLIKGMKDLFEAIIKIIADAIDKKSPYTGGHCRRVPALTMLIAEAASLSDDEPFKSFKLTDADRYELEIASWLHDCGKIVTPEHVVDKATKLQTIFDRIDLVEARFELAKADLEVAYWIKQSKESDGKNKNDLELQELKSRLDQLSSDFEFLQNCNRGSEFMRPEDQARLKKIAEYTWTSRNKTHHLITENELYNLSISRGTLTAEERQVINNHIDVTIEMLNALPFPRHLKNVPEFAGGHHERMDGKGYPNGLSKEQLSLQARIIGVADVFEALTAKDRPYKPGKKLSEALNIMVKMAQDQHLDKDLLQLFMKNKLYLQYAKEFLEPDQIDEIKGIDLVS